MPFVRSDVFEACSAFTRVTVCKLALSPHFVTRFTEGFNRFVTSTIASVGRQERLPGGVFTHWKSAALSRRTPRSVTRSSLQLDAQTSVPHLESAIQLANRSVTQESRRNRPLTTSRRCLRSSVNRSHVSAPRHPPRRTTYLEPQHGRHSHRMPACRVGHRGMRGRRHRVLNIIPDSPHPNCSRRLKCRL
jgi:hypothetical protein